MIYLFHGEDNYSSLKAARAQATSMSVAKDGELVIMDADESSPSDLARHFGATTLFQKQSGVLAKRLMTNSRLVEYLHDSLNEVLKNDLVIWNEGKVDGRLGLVKKLKQSAEVTEFPLQKDYEITGWLTTEAKKKGLKLSSSQVKFLVERVGIDKGRLVTELDKLVGMQIGGGGIDNDLLSKVVGLSASGDIWKFLDALSSGRKSQAIQEYEKLVRFGTNEQYLLSMIGREIWLMSQVKVAQDRGQGTHNLGIHPFVLKKTITKAAKFEWPLLQKLSLGLTRLDLAIKQGRVTSYDGLFIYLLSWPG